MNVVDSSGWLEYFAAGENAVFFAGPIEKTRELIVPTLSLYEVFKHVLQNRGEPQALEAVAAMHHGRIVDLDTHIAVTAARLSVRHHLPMADSVMLATARYFVADFWTQDSHFEGMAGVKYKEVPK